MSVSENQTVIVLRVQPNAGRNELAGFSDGVLRVMVSAPPSKGKANQELIVFISRLLEVAKSRVSITRGHASRNKVLAIDGLSQEEVMGRLLSSSSGGVTTR